MVCLAKSLGTRRTGCILRMGFCAWNDSWKTGGRVSKAVKIDILVSADKGLNAGWADTKNAEYLSSLLRGADASMKFGY